MHLEITVVGKDIFSPHPCCHLLHQYIKSCSLVAAVMELLYINLYKIGVRCKGYIMEGK